jgi:hypothetical protein
MVFLVALSVVVLCAVFYLLYRLRSLSKEVGSLQASLEGFVTLDEWEDSVQPTLSGLEKKQETVDRSLSVLRATVRGIRQDLLFSSTGKEASEEGEDPDPTAEASEEEEDYLRDDEASLEAAAQSSESNLQAMIVSMARLLQKKDDTSQLRETTASKAPSISQAKFMFGVPLARYSERPPSSTTIEEQVEEEDEGEEVP